jgi:hypothetical protein
LQSQSSPFFGKLRKLFYAETGKRKIDKEIGKILKSNLTLAVWYMDDGYYYKRDKSAHLYLPALSEIEINNLLKALENNYQLKPKWYCRPDRKSCQLTFTGEQKDLLFKLIRPHIIPYFNYKLPLTP